MGPPSAASSTAAPPGLSLDEAWVQGWLDLRKPGGNRFVTQRREPRRGANPLGRLWARPVTTGTPISIMIENTDQRSKDYGAIADQFRPGHADYAYFAKYGLRDPRGGGRSSARETAARVAAGAVARRVLGGAVSIRGAVVQIGPHKIDRARWDWDQVAANPFWTP